MAPMDIETRLACAQWGVSAQTFKPANFNAPMDIDTPFACAQDVVSLKC